MVGCLITAQHSFLVLSSSPCFSSSIVSGSHFRIYSILYDDERVAEFPPLVYCEDQCSTNGTYVNDVLIGKLSSPGSPFLLSDGDVITIRPHWAFVFHQEMTEKPYELADLQKMELQVTTHPLWNICLPL